MLADFTTIIQTVGAALGGTLVGVLTLRSSVKKAKAEADHSVVDNYEAYVNRTDQRLEKLEKKVDTLTTKNSILTQATNSAFACTAIKTIEECPVQRVLIEHHNETPTQC